MIYLDNAATTIPCEAAAAAALSCMTGICGNPSSLHKLGIEAEQVLNEARKSIASALVCPPDSLVFTSGATESNNLAIFGTTGTYGRRKKHIVASAIEHPSVEMALQRLEQSGYAVTRVLPGESGIEAGELAAAVREDTFLVTCMLVNNETGHIMPIRQAFAEIKRNAPECITHCDAVQGFLKLPIKAAGLNADLISISSHKVRGVKGTGALYVKKGVRLSPVMLGGGQEHGFRSGTENVPGIAAFGAAVRTLLPGIGGALTNAQELNRYLREKIHGISGMRFHFQEEDCLPYICSIAVEGIRSEILLHYLAEREIYVSSGSACAKGQLSGVLQAFGIPDRLADSTLRVSLSRETTWGEADALLNALQDAKIKFRLH